MKREIYEVNAKVVDASARIPEIFRFPPEQRQPRQGPEQGLRVLRRCLQRRIPGRQQRTALDDRYADPHQRRDAAGEDQHRQDARTARSGTERR